MLKALDFTNEMLLWKPRSGAVCESPGTGWWACPRERPFPLQSSCPGPSWWRGLTSPWKAHTVTIQVSVVTDNSRGQQEDVLDSCLST